MKKIISLLLTVTVLIGVASALASCGAPKNPGAQIAVYLGDEVYDFDPTDYYVDDNAEQVMTLLFEPLFKVTEKGKLECAAAKDYDVDEDNRTITITLRESYWSDGSLVVADHFIYAWRNLLDAGTANPAAALLYDVEGAFAVKSGEETKNSSELGFERVESDVIRIKYREGGNYKQLLKNLASIATSPVHFNNYEKAPSHWTKTSSTWIFNGPFQISGIDRDEGHFTLERNVGYHQSPDVKDYDNIVKAHKLISVFGVDGETVALSYSDIENKAVFYMGNASLAQRAAHGANTVKNDLSTYTYVFNTDKPLFNNAVVRRALSLAIDRNAIIAAIKYGQAANGFLPDMVVDIKNNSTLTSNALIDGAAKVNEAKQLLSTVTLPSDKSIELTVNKDEESIKIANLVKTAWEGLNVGITVTVNPVISVSTEIAGVEYEDSEIQYIVKNAAISGVRDFDVIGIDWQMYSTDAFVALSAFSSKMSGNGASFDEKGAAALRLNISGWQNNDYDALIKAAYEATDLSVRGTKLREAEAKLVDEAPVIPLVYNQNFAYTAKGISGLKCDGYGNLILTELKQKNYEEYLPKED